MAILRDLWGRARELVRIWVDLFARHELLTYASAIAFQVLKSLVPLSLLGIALLGAIGRDDVWTKHMAPAIQSRFDPPIYHAIDYGVKKILDHDSAGILVFAAILTVWYVSSGVRAIMSGINRIYEVGDKRPFWIRQPVSLGLAVCVVSGVVGAMLLVEVVPTPNGEWEYVTMAVRWVGAIAALVAVAGLLVRFAPAEHRPKRWASVGGVLVVSTWIVMTLAFRWYVASIANFHTAVGQLTVFLILMVYVYASSIVLIVGVQLDELLREEASEQERGVLDLVVGR
ncbi:MAG TPA: YihY/virulence factor BrkB family protein, partial [Gaiellaceae bacterium]